MAAKWSNKVRWGDIPERMRPGLIKYVEYGIKPGDFLRAVISNDLVEACQKADIENARIIPAYARFLVHECPAASWGSEKDLKEWSKRGGIGGDGNGNAPVPEHQWRRFQ